MVSSDVARSLKRRKGHNTTKAMRKEHTLQDLGLDSRSAQMCCLELATAATFLRSCAAQALSRGDGPCATRYTFHYNTASKDLIFFTCT